jgi:hypothetical protein
MSFEAGGRVMRKDVENTDAGKLYAAAYAAQFATRDIHKAFRLYQTLVAAFPRSKEAGNAKMQIRNIVNNLSARHESLTDQMDSASALFVPEK